MYSFLLAFQIGKNVVLAPPNLYLHWAFACFEKNNEKEVLRCSNANCKTREQITVARELPSSVWVCHAPDPLICTS